MPSLLVVPIKLNHPLDPDLFLAPLEEVFRIPVTTEHAPSIDPLPAFNAERNQYYSTQLLAALLQTYPRHDGKILGVTSLDLYVPVLTYVFGEAQLSGKAAVISARRLDEREYGLPLNLPLLHARLIKEALHELGHTYGLLHCIDQQCAMHTSTIVEEVDIKPDAFCFSCLRALREQEGMNP